MLRYGYIILILVFSLFTQIFATAEHKPFELFDWDKYEHLYNEFIYKVDDKEEHLSKLYALSKEDRTNLLAYIGLHNQDNFDNRERQKVKLLASNILNDPVISIENIYNHDSQKKVDLLIPYVRDIMLGDKYDKELKHLYFEIAGREPLTFWQSYDVFKNMIAFGNKKKTLYIHKKINNGLVKVYKINPEFKRLEQLLNEDVKKISNLLDIEAPNVILIYHPKRKAAAWYREKNNSISINIAYSNMTWTKLTGEILWHEIYHAYQYHMINTYIQEDINKTKEQFIKNSELKENIWLAAVYNANLIGYQSSTLNYSRYRNQPIEDSAWIFGRSIHQKILS